MAVVPLNTSALCLSDLCVGQSAVVIEPSHLTSISQRLREMGFTPGTPVQLIRCGPGGCPMQFAVRGYQLMMRSDDARHIAVQINGTV